MHSSRTRRLCGSLTAILLLSLTDPFVSVSSGKELEAPDVKVGPRATADEPRPAEAPDLDAPRHDAPRHDAPLSSQALVELPEASPAAPADAPRSPAAMPASAPKPQDPVVNTNSSAGPPRAQAPEDAPVGPRRAQALEVEETKRRVTGSRIARSRRTAYGRITVVDDEQIRAVGTVTADELLRRLPGMMTGQGLGASSRPMR